MTMTWILFILLAAIGYVFLTIVSSGIGYGSQSLGQSLGRMFSPMLFTFMVIGNVMLAAAIYYGFLASSYAVTILIAIGVITSAVYSVVFLGGVVTLQTILGFLFILLGIYLIK